MKRPTSRAVRIEICGGVASGKTTLAKLLGRQGLRANFEQFRSNPFWERFYENPSKHAFETEVSFLLQHYSDIKYVGPDPKGVLCDYSLLQDLAYADVNLTGGGYQAFKTVYAQVVAEIGMPGLLVHLTCRADAELQRIRARRRPQERGITTQYLTALNEAIRRRVRTLESTLHVVTIDSEANDFAHDTRTKKQIARLIMAARNNALGDPSVA